MLLDLTILILTKNEESNIEHCINSFNGIARRFVVVDSGSTDNTIVLAKKLGADVYHNDWIDYATQLNWGINNTQIDTIWTMRMDADEYLTPKLCEEILERLPQLSENITGIELRRRVYFLGKWIKHGGIYPTILLRIFKTGMSYCEQTIMDEHMILLNGETVRFKNDFVNGDIKSLSWWIDKHNWYSDREVIDYFSKKNQLQQNKTITPKLFGSTTERKRWLKYNFYYKLPGNIRSRLYFIYRYYLRMGFLDGKEGYMFHFLQGYWYRYLIDMKLYEKSLSDCRIQNFPILKNEKVE